MARLRPQRSGRRQPVSGIRPRWSGTSAWVGSCSGREQPGGGQGVDAISFCACEKFHRPIPQTPIGDVPQTRVIRNGAALDRSDFVIDPLLADLICGQRRRVHGVPTAAKLTTRESRCMFTETTYLRHRRPFDFESAIAPQDANARTSGYRTNTLTVHQRRHSPSLGTGTWLARGMVVILSFATLCGCAPYLSGANEAGGIVSGVRMRGLLENTSDAFAVANASCQRNGKIARMETRLNGRYDPDGTISFDCVSP